MKRGGRSSTTRGDLLAGDAIEVLTELLTIHRRSGAEDLSHSFSGDETETAQWREFPHGNSVSGNKRPPSQLMSQAPVPIGTGADGTTCRVALPRSFRPDNDEGMERTEEAVLRYPLNLIAALAAIALLTAACSSDSTSAEAVDSSGISAGSSSTFVAEVWVDNWFSLTVNGEFVGEDSVPITTERSFNAETFTFEATYPLTIAVEAKDFKETDSGLEYIGENNQQMGDGGLILQITDQDTGAIVAVTSDDWRSLVIHEAPLNKDCEDSDDPENDCESRIVDAPPGWTDADFDDSAWSNATVWSSSDVGPKDGYDEISWSSSAQLIWGTDLESDNTVLARFTVGP